MSTFFFRGTYEHTLDSKGRVAVPKKFRDGLLEGTDDDEIMVTYGLSEQLFVYSKAQFDIFTRSYAKLPGEDVCLLDRIFVATANECPIDAQGRILLPSAHKAHAGLERDIVWVGQRDHVELWSASRWAMALDAVQKGNFLVSNERLQQAYSKITLSS